MLQLTKKTRKSAGLAEVTVNPMPVTVLNELLARVITAGALVVVSATLPKGTEEGVTLNTPEGGGGGVTEVDPSTPQ